VPDPSFFAEVDRLTYLDEDVGSPAAPAFRPIRPVPDSAVGHPGGRFLVPRLARRIHVNVQIACVVGRPIGRGTDVTGEAIFGYTVMSSCRELGFAELVESPLAFGVRDRGIARLWHSRWRDGSHPIGPWIVPTDRVDFRAVTARLAVEHMGCTAAETVRSYDGVHTLSQVTPLFTFEPGDIVGLGALTDELVIDAPLAAPARVTAEVEGIGRLTYYIDTARWDPAARYRPRYRPHVAEALGYRSAAEQDAAEHKEDGSDAPGASAP
jgi:2-keto-4-pentenoate hydratase/2-oxohepta-3-ene-1,7-dioic acid hydratase in catechol pathway